MPGAEVAATKDKAASGNRHSQPFQIKVCIYSENNVSSTLLTLRRQLFARNASNLVLFADRTDRLASNTELHIAFYIIFTNNQSIRRPRVSTSK